ncbi:hypothetical protein Tco_0666291 [Tanacetum coccineum]
MPGRSTTEAIHLLTCLMEKYKKDRDLHMPSLDLEKAYHSVPRELIWRTLIDKGTPKRYLRVIRNELDWEAHNELGLVPAPSNLDGFETSPGFGNYYAFRLRNCEAGIVKVGFGNTEGEKAPTVGGRSLVLHKRRSMEYFILRSSGKHHSDYDAVYQLQQSYEESKS